MRNFQISTTLPYYFKNLYFSDSFRILIATWWIFTVIVTSFYTANLTAFLTFNDLDLPVKSIYDLKDRSDLTWLAASDGALEEYIQVSYFLHIKSCMEASELKCVNSNYILYGVNSLRL